MLLLALLAPWAANAQEPIPYNEGFETMSSADDLTTAGWISHKSSSGSFLAIETTASNVHTGSKALNIDSWDASSSSDWVVVGLPIVNEAINGLQITFSYKVSTGNVSIGYLTDANDASTFVPLQQYNASSSYTTITKELDEAPASAARIAIKYQNWYRCYIDDIEVKALPTCLKPTNLMASNITTNTANLSWTANSGESVWTIFYKKTTDENYTEVSNVTDNPHTLPGLSEATDYQFYVVAKCSSTDISDPSSVKTFSTACEAISTFPVTYTFETADGFPSNASTPTTNQLGACWRNEATVQTGSNSTRVWGTSTSYKKNGSQSLTLPDKGSSSNPAKTMLVFPAMNFTSANGYVVSFWVYRNGSSSNPEGFKVYASDTDTIGANAVELGHYSRNYGIAYPQVESTSNWYYYETDPITMTGTTYIIFEGQSYYGSATYVDDVTIKIAPTCFIPTEAHAEVLDANNATISWTPDPLNAAGGSYSILDAEHNVVPGADQLTGTSFSLSGLNPETNYTYYVRTNCSNSEENVDLVEVNFSTPADCAAPVLGDDAFTNVSAHQATVSWTGFASNNEFVVSYRSAAYLDGITEEFGATSIPEGWKMYTGLLVGNTAELSEATYGWSFGSGNGVFDNHARVNIYSTYQRWLVTPAITIPNNAVLDFDMALTAYSGNLSAPATTGTDDKFIVLISTDNKSTWTTLREWNNSGSAYVYNEIANSATGENVNIDLSSFAGQSAYIAFYGESTESNADNNLHIDNVAIGTAIPAGAWQTVSPNPTTTSTTLTDLTAETPYEVKVNGICTGTQEETGSAIQSFTTTIACPKPNTLTVAANAVDPTTKENLTWVMTGAETDWQISCLNGAVENIIDINESAVSINPTTHEVSYTLSGLIPGQVYTVKVRANCEASVPGDQTSDWSNTQNFQTEATCVEPTDFAHGTVDAHNAPLSWTEAGAATQWQICINNDMDNLILISNTTPGVAVEGQNVSYTLTGLTAETDYTVKLRAYCADGDGNQSPWVTTSFTTLVACPAPTDLQVEASALDATFSWEGEAGSYEVVTSMNSSDNPSDLVSTPVTGNNFIFTNLELGNHYFWVRSNCSANGEGYSTWAGPVSVHIGYCVPSISSIDGSAITNVTFGTGDNIVNNNTASVKYGDYTAQIGSVQAGVEATVSITYGHQYTYGTFIWVDFDNSLTFDDDEVVYYGQASGSNPHTLNATFTIPATQATGDYVMRIGGIDVNYGHADANSGAPCYSGSWGAFQDYTLRLLEAPSCLTPTDVEVTYAGGTSATISWTSEATAWNMRVNGVDVNGVITNPYTLTGLELATTYSVEVQANCGANGTSEWSTPVSFTTDFCMPENMCEITFELTDTYGDGWNGNYISVVDVLTNTEFAQLTNEDLNGTSGSGENELNTINLPVCDGREIQFQYHIGVGNTYPEENSWVIKDVNDEIVWEGQGSDGESDQNYTVDCTIPTCAKPTAFAATNPGPHSIDLSWTENGTATQWQICVNGDETQPVTANTNPFTLTGLDPETGYTVKVRAYCDATDQSAWSSEISFITDVACPAPTNLDATNITAQTATLEWNGTAAGEYEVRYAEGEAMQELYHNDGAYSTVIGLGGGEFEWGVMFPAGTYTENKLTKVSVYDQSAMTGTVNIYNDGATEPDATALVATKVIEFTGAEDWIDITFNDVTIDPTQNVWIIFDNVSGAGYPAAACADAAGDVNGRWVGLSGTWSDLANAGMSGYAWMIRAIVEDYDAYGSSVTTTDETYTLTNLTPATTYTAQVRAICGGTDGESAWVSTVFTTETFTMTKNIVANSWYALSSPVNTPNVTDVTNLTDGDYDFYRYNEVTSTWENYKAHRSSNFTTFENGRGYIYRNSTGNDLTFTGVPNTATDYPYLLTAEGSGDLAGFNLLGNPYATDYNYSGVCYNLTEKGTWKVNATGYDIPVCEAILIKVESETPCSFTSSKSAPKAVEALAFTVSGNGYEDVTYAMLEEGEGLTKVAHLADEAPALSIPVDGSNYAIAYLGYEVESFPLTLNVQAGEYTIALNNQISGLSYCHLLDKETGKETDLLKGAYTFKANGNSDRFTVLLNASLENGEIAIWNGNSWIVNGEGTLQVFDVMGRRVYNQEVAGQSSLNTDELATGVYVIRLGEKSQKIVVK